MARRRLDVHRGCRIYDVLEGAPRSEAKRSNHDFDADGKEVILRRHSDGRRSRLALDVHRRARGRVRHEVAVDRLAVHGEARRAGLAAVHDVDAVLGAAAAGA